MSLLCFRGVEKTYRSGGVAVHALRGVNLVIERGELTALVGPSGSGKTTLLNLAGALDRPTAGTVLLDDVPLGSLDRAALAQLRLHRIGFVFQSYNLVPVLSALENAELVLALRGTPARERRRRAEEALASVGLADLAHRRPHELSGGQQQRVAVARALAADPALILADEPTANLDSETAGELLDTMVRLHRERGVGFLFSTHDRLVMSRATRCVTLLDGRVVGG